MKKIGNWPITEADTNFLNCKRCLPFCTLYLLFEENDTFGTQTLHFQSIPKGKFECQTAIRVSTLALKLNFWDLPNMQFECQSAI